MALIKFSKLHGCGNDFIVTSFSELPASHRLADNYKILCDRHRGIGSDGIMLVEDIGSDSQFAGRTKIEVQMFNPDGSDMGMCGNGIRCVVRYLCIRHSQQKAELHFWVSGRDIYCMTSDAGQNVTVDMGTAQLNEDQLSIETESGKVLGSTVSIGNPHFVIFQENLDIFSLGPVIEKNPYFPQRTNVEFARVLQTNLLDLKVWERGAGWTQACGSGACATAFVAHLKGLTEAKTTVILPGGRLYIECCKLDQSAKRAQVIMTGPAIHVFDASVDSKIF